MKWLWSLGLAGMLAGSAGAWQPSGWVYHDHPWAYDGASGDWYWFNPDVQWVVNMSNGQWAHLSDSAVATGWGYYDWAYVYAQGSGAWHWFNPFDVQWVVNMGTAEWTRFGEAEGPGGMVRIPGGTNTVTDPDFGVYSLAVETFWMDEHEVTKALWDEVYTWAIGHGYAFGAAGAGKGTNHPVQTVSWHDAVKWCNARSEKEGRAAVYTAGGAVYRTGQVDNVVQTGVAGYRLPTSEEWEYAARGGVSTRRFSWADSDEIQHERANYESNSNFAYDSSPTRGYHPVYETGGMPYTSPVGSFAANGYGLQDMTGNIMEWCFDWYPGQEGTYRVLHGGSWYDYASTCRVGYGYGDVPTRANTTYGFRTVWTADP